MQDGRSFAVSLTDRQLGWIRLVQPWEDYAKQGHDLDDNEGWELGFKAGGAKEMLYWENRYDKYSSSEESSDRSTGSGEGDEENSESDSSAEFESNEARVERKDREMGLLPFDVILQDPPQS